MNFWILAAAAPAAGKPGTDAGTLNMIMIVGMLVLFWVLMIMPQRKRQKQMATMMSSLKKGDKVVTIGGIHGEIAAITDEDVLLRISEKTEVLFAKSAIARVKN
jgi:preprotein translocase subunit YajC